MKERVVVTGMGVLTPIGIGVDEYWGNLIMGKSGVGFISRFDTHNLNVKAGAEIKNFKPEEYLSRKLIRETDIFMQYALIAASEAIDNAGLEGDPERIGVVLGTALGGLSTTIEGKERYDSGGRLSPHFVPKMLSNVAAAQISIAHKLRGPNLTVSTACSSGADAVGMAGLMLQAGEADVIVAVGAESIFNPVMASGLYSARALSTRSDYPEKASRPFDLNRDGFVLGEGGGAIVLETLEHARRRNASIKAELIGYASYGDGYHTTSPDPSGRGEVLCMNKALQKAGISPSEVDYINAHGTSTKLGDQLETLAVKKVFGSYAKETAISSTKGATGHLMGAGGLTELITCVKAIQDGIIPPTINYEEKDSECDLDYVPNTARKAKVNVAMSNSFGFGGQNASLIVRAFG